MEGGKDGWTERERRRRLGKRRHLETQMSRRREKTAEVKGKSPTNVCGFQLEKIKEKLISPSIRVRTPSKKREK